MKRLPQIERADWRQKMASLGFGFHSIDGVYWKEHVAYRFSAQQIDTFDDGVTELHAMCMDFVDDFIRAGDWGHLRLPDTAIAAIERSWRRRDPGILGRFDFSWDGVGAPKMLEYNADTPTSLMESSLAQWTWKMDVQPEADQFNSLHEKLVARWSTLRLQGHSDVLHFAGQYEQEEDAVHLDYLLDTALQAGWRTQWLAMKDVGWDGAFFVDHEGAPIRQLFKLYPWEWIWRDIFAEPAASDAVRWIEPPWKLLLSSKSLTVHLWQRHPGHPLLLPAAFDRASLPPNHAYARKPMFSREGGGCSLHRADGALIDAERVFEETGDWVYQVLAPLPRYEDYWSVVGGWVVGDDAAGLCIREDASAITKNSSHFVPHYFV